MRYGKIKYFDVANGSGVRTSLFVSGCRRNCPGCFSPETWDFNFGGDFTDEVEEKILDSMDFKYISGLSVLGGEPMESRRELIPFLKKVKEKFPEKDIWIFTGYDWAEISLIVSVDGSMKEIMELVDVMKVGDFVQGLYEPGLQFRGSRNQELIDIRKSLETGYKVLWEGSIK